MGLATEGRSKNRTKGTFVNAPLYVRSHVYMGIPIAADCSRVTWPCPEVTRVSLDFSCSLRGLSCLLQKHRLRYTIKLPSPIRELASLLSLFLLLLPPYRFSSPFLARSFFSYLFVPIGWLSRQRLVVVAVVVVVRYMKIPQRKMQRPSSRSP